MATLIDIARSNEANQNEIIEKVSSFEEIDKNIFIEKIKKGEYVVPLNIKNKNKRKIIGIGDGLTTKVNVNIGASPKLSGLELERKKLHSAIKYGADAVMDLSIGNKASEVRKMVIEESTVPVGTVPIYEALNNVKGKGVEYLTKENLFDTVEKQGEEGVDFVTIHAGVLFEDVYKMKSNPRLAGIVSRGGAITAEWMLKNKKENPFFEYFDDLLKILKKYDMALSLGDGMRPGAIKDATDYYQIEELKILGKLFKKANEFGVQTMIEGPGHIPLNQIEKNIKLEKEYCYNAPFYVLGPLVTDIAPGYDHITAAIGGALAGYYGANFLCFVTPAEHLHLPDEKDTIDGLIATKIAANASDIAKGNKKAIKRAEEISLARKNFDWEKQKALSINPDEVERRLKLKGVAEDGVCTMCGEFCSMKRMNSLN